MRPPRIAEVLVHWLCDDGQHADIPSDLEEEFEHNLAKRGAFKARLKYAWTALRLIRPFILKDKFILRSRVANSAIIKSSLTTFRRNAVREKTNFTLSFLGLSLGLTCFLLILNYVTHELSYDKFHEKSDSIYRVTYAKKKDGVQSFHTVLAYSGLGRPLKEEFDEITEFVRVRPVNVVNARALVRTHSGSYDEDRVHFADPSFLTIFSFDLLRGSKKSALSSPFRAVVSESISKKYFGDSDPMGQILDFGDGHHFTITGVLEDAPENSHIQYNVLLSHSSLGEIMSEEWSEDDMAVFHGQLYIESKQGADIENVKDGLPEFIDDFIWTQQPKLEGLEFEISIMPMADVHLRSTAQNDTELNGSHRTINLLIWTALIVLVLAWANHTSLVTARSVERLKELGIRMVLGSRRNLFLRQSMIESAAINFLSLLLAITLVYLAGPVLNDLGIYGKSIPAPSQNTSFWVVLIGIFVLGTISTGLISAISIRKHGPLLKLRLLKSLSGKSIRTSKFRKALIVFQLSICVMLLSGAIVGYMQLNYLRKAELGIDIEKSLVIRTPLIVDSTYTQKVEHFKKDLLNSDEVKNITFSTDIPSSHITRSTWYKKQGDPDSHSQYAYRTFVDENFITAFEIELLAGKNFGEGYPGNEHYPDDEITPDHDSIRSSQEIIINETFMNRLKIKEPKDALGLILTYEGNVNAIERYEIIGVSKDYYQLSVKAKSVPQILIYGDVAVDNFVVKLSDDLITTEQMVDAIAEIEFAFNTRFPGNRFNASFLDTQFEKLYESDRQLRNTFILFSTLSIIVTALGLLGLSLHNVIQRSKEISIRKILGSSSTQITGFLFRDYIKLIVIANLITWPLSYYLLDFWLSYTSDKHINIQWWLFPMIFLFICLVAIITVGANTYKAANTSPVHYLKAE